MMKYLEGGVLIEGRIYSSGSSSVRKPVAARPLPLSLSKILIARVAALHNFVMHPVNARYHLSHGEGTHVGVLRHSLSYPVTAQLRAYVSLIDWNYPRNLYATRKFTSLPLSLSRQFINAGRPWVTWDIRWYYYGENLYWKNPLSLSL